MAKFCGKCGARLDEATGLCPNCDADKLNEAAGQEEKAHVEASDTPAPMPAQSKKELKKQKKAEKKAVKKAAKKAKRASWSLGKKIRHFILKFILIIMFRKPKKTDIVLLLN